jgi:prepilin-type N-terminal cleavage/methylation domain-containing protein
MKYELKKQKNNAQNGFTLVETLVSLLVISLILTAATGLITRTLNATTISQDRFTASKLAAEGIELIKAKRNRNIAEGVSPWTDELVGLWEVDSTQKLALDENNSFLVANPSSPRVLCKRTSPASEAGKYTHSCATDSEPLPGNFTRIVEVTSINSYSVQVNVTVTWNGGANSLQVSTVLFELS